MTRDDAGRALSSPSADASGAARKPNPLFDRDRTRALAAAAEMLRTEDLEPLRAIFDGNVSMELRQAVLGLFAATPGEVAEDLLWWVLLRKPHLSETRNLALAALADRHGLPKVGAAMRKEGQIGDCVDSRGIRVLEHLGDRRGVPLLRAALLEPEYGPEPSDMPHLVGALRKMGGAEAFDVLVLCLDDITSSTRAAAREALLSFGSASVPRLLEAFGHDESERIRREAARALGELRDPSAVPLLLEALPTCFEVAVGALAQIGTPGLEALAQQNFQGQELDDAVQVLGARGEPVRPALTEALRLHPTSPLLRQVLAHLNDA